VQTFAFYGRVSTEDHQDPTALKAWQLKRSRQLLEPMGGQIVAEYFDIGQSRAVPWSRRPEASRLLGSFECSERGFQAVVIGGAATGVLREPVWSHVPGFRALWGWVMGARGGGGRLILGRKPMIM